MTQVTSGRDASAPTAFSTVGLPEEQRIELWESHNAEALIGLRCHTLTAAVLEATEVNVQLEQIHLARVRGSAHVVERDLSMVRKQPTDAVALFFSLAGEAFFYHDDGVRTVQPGEMLVCDADRPFMRGFSRGLEELVLKIPHDVFADVTGIDDIARPIVMSFAAGTSSFAHSLARKVGAAVRAEDANPAEEQVILELVAALAGKNRDEVSSAHHAAAATYIDHHLSDPALSAAEVAAAVGISLRHLSRVFARAGSSVPRHIRRRRLERARQLLDGRGATATTIAEVAHRCGFLSAAHFSRAFRAHFGERPSDARRRAVTAWALPLL